MFTTRQFDFDYFPVIPFKPDWRVRIIPPYNGAAVRFCVSYENSFVSVFADVDSNLGVLFDEEGGSVPYWEVYPIDGDYQRCELSDVGGLVALIERSLDYYRRGSY